MLSVFEELFLLALDEEKGNSLPFVKKSLAHALAGGILAELAFLGKVCSNEKHRLELVDAAPTGDENLDRVIKEMKSSDKPRKPAYWVSQLSARPNKLRERIGEGLVAKKLLFQEERRFFWRDPAGEDDAATAPSKFEIKKPLRASVLSTDEVDLHDLALMDLASGAGLLNLIFTQDELGYAPHRIHEKVVRSALKEPVMQTIQEIEQAIVISLEDDTD